MVAMVFRRNGNHIQCIGQAFRCKGDPCERLGGGLREVLKVQIIVKREGWVSSFRFQGLRGGTGFCGLRV